MDSVRRGRLPAGQQTLPRPAPPLSTMGYGEAPWVFSGRALYQLHAVRVEEARKYVPPEFRLVSLFG